MKGSVIIGLPREVWKSTTCQLGMVPSKQAIEYLIALRTALFLLRIPSYVVIIVISEAFRYSEAC